MEKEELKLRVVIPGVKEDMTLGDKSMNFFKWGVIGHVKSDGTKKELDATVSTHEKGIKIYLKNLNKELKVGWDEMLDVKNPGLFTSKVILYLTDERMVTFVPGKTGHLTKIHKIVKSNMCGEKKIEEEEGWD